MHGTAQEMSLQQCFAPEYLSLQFLADVKNFWVSKVCRVSSTLNILGNCQFFPKDIFYFKTSLFGKRCGRKLHNSSMTSQETTEQHSERRRNYDQPQIGSFMHSFGVFELN